MWRSRTLLSLKLRNFAESGFLVLGRNSETHIQRRHDASPLDASCDPMGSSHVFPANCNCVRAAWSRRRRAVGKATSTGCHRIACNPLVYLSRLPFASNYFTVAISWGWSHHSPRLRCCAVCAGTGTAQPRRAFVNNSQKVMIDLDLSQIC